MNRLRNLFFLLVAVLGTLTSCTHSIKIDITRQSSELNRCEIVFGTDLYKLNNENAILLQTGVIDTSEEHVPIPVAIVIIDKKEIILKLVSNSEVGNETSRIYEGHGYKLSLSYKKEIAENRETIFTGKFLIENKNLKSEYDIIGSICNL